MIIEYDFVYVNILLDLRQEHKLSRKLNAKLIYNSQTKMKNFFQRDLIKSKEEYCYKNQVELIETIIFHNQSQFVKD